jgi:hypothetical protein
MEGRHKTKNAAAMRLGFSRQSDEQRPSLRCFRKSSRDSALTPSCAMMRAFSEGIHGESKVDI